MAKASMRLQRWLGGACVVLAACSDPTGEDAAQAAEALAWLEQAAAPLAAVDPAASTSDLTALKTMIGSARVIGVGEATHGSHEFFAVKDRLFRYLVEEGGVTAFAIEATMPEAFALDTYVRTGAGDPAVLLSHLYFWTWNTQAVADLIAWLRQWNAVHADHQVGFYGFDMQYPGVAIDSVMSYVDRVAPELTATFAGDYSCLADYRNDTHGHFPKRYQSAGPTVWNECGPKLEAAYQELFSRRDALTEASSERDFALAVRMAAVVLQWEVMTRSDPQSRDAWMARNIEWLLDREGPSGKLFVWAHNYHVSRGFGTMGLGLTYTLGTDYLPIGFAFGSGGLNAVEARPDNSLGRLQPFVAPPPTAGSYEATLQEVTAPDYYVDLRPATGAARAWLAGPRRMRSVGSVYFPSNPDANYATSFLTSQFDVLIFIETTTPSTLLPFQF